MKIKEVENRVGMTRANIRYYEQEGLLKPTIRNENNYREYSEEEDSGITVQCDKKCVVLYGKYWEKRLNEITDSIVFIDESGRFTKSTDFPAR